MNNFSNLDPQPNNPLFEACYEGDIKKINDFLDQGFDINSKTNSGSTLLHIAAQNNYLDMANILLARGAEVNALTEDGWTPLHFAAQKGYEELVKVLIKAGVNLDIAGLRYHRTALHYAADQGRDGVVMILLAAGANHNLLDKSGDTPLSISNKKSNFEVSKHLINQNHIKNA